MSQIQRSALACAALFALTGTAQALTFGTDDGRFQGNFDSSISMGVGVRTKSPACEAVVGTTAGVPTPPVGSGAPAGCLDLAAAYNDQGNLNYKKGEPFTGYIKGSHELLVKAPDGYKFLGRVNWLKDLAATQTSGYGSGINDGLGLPAESFPPGAKKETGFKARLLDFWVSKDFEIGDQNARLRVGNQVINWGESLFLSGGINESNALDYMRLSQPGTQLKEVYLPTPMISFKSGVGSGVDVEAYVQGAFTPNYFPPVGSYWSATTIGKGADTFAGGTPGVAVPTGEKPSGSGQFGLAIKYKPEDLAANFGAYAIRYHAKTPVLVTPSVGSARYEYVPDLTMFGLSTNFPLGNWAIGAEISHRPNDPVALNPAATGALDCSGNGGNCYAKAKKTQINVTGLLSLTPGDHPGVLNLLGADAANLAVEVAGVRYSGLQRSYGGLPLAAGYWGWGTRTATDTGFTTGEIPSVGSKNSWGFNFDFSWSYDSSLIPGWVVTPGVYYFQAVNGRTPNGLPLFMKGAKSMNAYLVFSQNPPNWTVTLNYARFEGGESVFDQPFRGRDFFGAVLTRNF